MLHRLLLLGMMLALTGGVAQAQAPDGRYFTTLSVDQASIFLQDNRYPSEVITNSDGTRSLRTKVADLTTLVNFYGCGSGEQCRSIQFRAYFTNPRKRGVDFANRWNRTKRFMKIYVESSREIAAEMDVVVEGGISHRNLLAALDLYATLMRDFRTEYNK